MTELWPLRRCAKMREASKNDTNLTITLPNFNIFHVMFENTAQILCNSK